MEKIKLYVPGLDNILKGGVSPALLYSLEYAKKGNEEFTERILKALEKTVKFPKKLIWLMGGEIITSRKAAKKRLVEILGDIDLTALDEIDVSFSKPEELYRDLDDVGKARRLLTNSLDCMELMVDTYVKKFPKVSERELKG